MPDGKPDLSGFWQGPLLRNMFESVGGPPFTPAGEAAYRYNMTQSDQSRRALPVRGSAAGQHQRRAVRDCAELESRGVPVRADDRVALDPLDGRQQPPMNDIEESYFGHGVGRWDGDTLVIDSIGFKDKLSWVDDDAHPHSDAMHVVERWSRPDWDHLKHDLWVEDPKFYTKPWTFSRVFTHMAPGKQPMEYACTENNKDLVHGLGFGPQQPDWTVTGACWSR